MLSSILAKNADIAKRLSAVLADMEKSGRLARAFS
jgi:hypothetical protein